ncbi:MAG TPA: ATP-binding protein [Flavisolibacter sp.]|nr:ATP-binding protein [Flavisolibacter sp.]
MMVKRIVIIGPESSGKSTLCQQLAAHYSTVWCPEYARDYLTRKGMNYTYEDLTAIAEGQLSLQQKTEARACNGLYFVDTDMYVMKVWHEVAFGSCPAWILKTIARTRHDLYLLCNTDLPWTQDDLREYPDLPMRQKLFCMYKDVVINSNTPWAVVSGISAERLDIAINAVDAVLTKTCLLRKR